jgi:hypothetical protein
MPHHTSQDGPETPDDKGRSVRTLSNRCRQTVENRRLPTFATYLDGLIPVAMDRSMFLTTLVNVP